MNAPLNTDSTNNRDRLIKSYTETQHMIRLLMCRMDRLLDVHQDYAIETLNLGHGDTMGDLANLQHVLSTMETAEMSLQECVNGMTGEY